MDRDDRGGNKTRDGTVRDKTQRDGTGGGRWDLVGVIFLDLVGSDSWSDCPITPVPGFGCGTGYLGLTFDDCTVRFPPPKV